MKTIRSVVTGVASVLAVMSSVGVSPDASALPLTGVYRGEVYSQPNTVNAYSTWLGYSVTLGQGHQAKDSWANIENPTWQLQSWGTWVRAQPGRRLNYSVSMFPSGQGSLAECAQGLDVQAGDGHHQLSNVDNAGGNTFQTEFPNAAAVFKSHYAGLNASVSASKATVSPATVTRGSSFQVAGSVTASAATTVVVKYEIRTATPLALIAEKSYTAQAFTAGQTRAYTSSFVIPASSPAGTYRVDTLVFTSDWSKTLLYRNDTLFTAN